MQIGIVTPSYNQAQFLEYCIQSVLNQATDSCGLVYAVIDGGSSDCSPQIIDRYRDRLSFVRIGKDRGASDALNVGFSSISADVFGYINSDDALAPRALDYVARFFDENPDVGFVYGDLMFIDCNGRPYRYPWSFGSKQHAVKFTADDYVNRVAVLGQQSCFWRRSVFEEFGPFNIDNRTCWDHEFFMKLITGGVVCRPVPQLLSYFRIHDASITGSGRLRDQFALDSARVMSACVDSSFRKYSLIQRLIRKSVYAGRRGLRLL